MGKRKGKKCKKNKYVDDIWWPKDCKWCNKRDTCELSEGLFNIYDAAVEECIYGYDLSEIEMLKDWDE